MKNIVLFRPVRFRLDGNWEGEGIVKALYSRSMEVELTKPCKEFETGVMIIVDFDEVIDDFNNN